MKKILVAILLSLMTMSCMSGTDEDLNWYSRLDEAQKAAQKEDKPILLFFTGSDWCGWCKKLVAQVLSQPAFKDYAEQSLVLVKLDFPRNIAMDQRQKEYNNSLAKQYQVAGFPTIFLLSSDGEVLGQTGYQDLTPDAYVEHLKAFIK